MLLSFFSTCFTARSSTTRDKFDDGSPIDHGEVVKITIDSEGTHGIKVVASDGNGKIEDEITVIGKLEKKKEEEEEEESPGFEITGIIIALLCIVSAYFFNRGK